MWLALGMFGVWGVHPAAAPAQFPKKKDLGGSPGASAGLAQRGTPVRYGAIVEAEFTAAGQVHLYTISTNPGDRPRARVQPVGDTLQTALGFFGPTGALIASDPPVGSGGRFERMEYLTGAEALPGQKMRMLALLRVVANPTIESPPLSSRGAHTLLVTNGRDGGVGVYRILIGGVLRDGTEINPGEAAEEGAPPANARPTKGRTEPRPAEPAAFRGIGFPGLPPVDFADAVTIDLPADGAARGAIKSPQDALVRGFTLTPQANATYELTLTRTKGGFPLGLVVLSAANEVLGQASLTAAGQVTMRLTFPAGGPATIGVHRVALGTPSGDGPTEFEIRARPVGRAR
jgi:hypothetical protein